MRRVYLYLRRHYPDQVYSSQGLEFGYNLSLAYAKHPEVSSPKVFKKNNILVSG
jgi:hypothetical protein